MSQPTPTQELVAKDLHGYEWRFKHIFRGKGDGKLMSFLLSPTVLVIELSDCLQILPCF